MRWFLLGSVLVHVVARRVVDVGEHPDLEVEALGTVVPDEVSVGDRLALVGDELETVC
ncbi:MAG: hypothetical protein JWO98_537 [Frankiales bacterium]|nr:hypothetical protein [Frankiales bacterium]